ncbi:MAG TPA: ABC transporter ATP-binding protein [Longimicrobiales bacterium]
MSFRATDLRVRYAGAASPALDGVSMSVPEGALYAILGPNGSGKSTLMRTLMGILRPESGGVWIEDRRVERWDRRELARAVGAVPQSEAMAFPLSVRELVAMGRYPHLGPLSAEGAQDREAVDRALDRCDVAHLRERPVTSLSGGEVQRVRIARALAQEPRSLVLDEPTASLDIRHEMAILGLLRQSADGGMTVLVITHHLDLAGRFADRLLLLDQGRVVSEGEPRDVLQADILSRVYGWPVAVDVNPITGAPRITPLNAGPPPPP